MLSYSRSVCVEGPNKRREPEKIEKKCKERNGDR